MQSPPVSPSRQRLDHGNSTINLQGSSCITGGILCGQAQGNVFNNAVADLMPGHGLERRIGRVQVYTTHADPTVVKADMELTHEVMPKLTQVLKVLARKYSPVRSMVSSSYLVMLILTYYFLR
jgi:hypothetical protein